MISIKKQVSLEKMTTFQIGGPARYFVDVHGEDELREALSWARAEGVPFFVMGGGSNLLVQDEGYDGLVIHMAGTKYGFADDMLTAEAGCNLLHLIRAAGEEGLGSWEKLAGIPGTIGGAVRGNAGAFGPEIKDFVTWVKVMNTTTEEVHEFSNSECKFSYRQSYFKQHSGWVILDVQARLAHAEPEKIRMSIAATIVEREKRHIQNVRAAGSYFMNPVASPQVREQFETEKGVESRGGRVPAGWLIEKAGMKGARVGGALCSTMHPNYLVNESGAAKASDVQELAAQIKRTVHERFNITLEEEACVL